MELADGITQQDITLFLTEADEQLQLLDEDIVRLEREADNNTLLQEIFRASHTIKGSSAMIGHQRMSHLAHGMENVLDKVRKKTLAVSAQVVDALLVSLDALRVLREELVTGEESKLDINVMLNDLEAAMNPGKNEAGQDGKAAKANNAKGYQNSLNEEARGRLSEAISKGEHPYIVKVTVSNETGWASVRCYQIIQELSKTATIINSIPSATEIEAGNAGPDMELTVTSTDDETTLQKALEPVPEIVKLAISSYDEETAGEGGEKAPAGEAATGKEEAAAKIEEGTVKDHEVKSNTVKKEESDAKNNGVKKEDSGVKQTIRVDVSRLDTLMEQIGELVINRNHIGQIGKTLAERYQDDELVQRLSESLSETGKIVNILQQDIMTIRMLPIELVFSTMPRMVRDLARKLNKKINFIVEGQETEVDRSVIEHLHDPLIHLLRNSVDHGIESPEERLAAGKPETGTIRLSAFHEQDHIVITVTDDGKGIDPNAVKAASVAKGVISQEIAARLSETELMNLIMASGVSTARKVTEVSGRGVGLDIVKKNIEFLNGSINVDSELGKGSKFTLKLPLTLAIIASLMVSVEKTMYAIPLVNIVEAIKLDRENIQTVLGKEVSLYRGNVLPLIRLSSIFKLETGKAAAGDMTHIVIVKASNTQVGIIVDTLIGQQEIVVKALDQFIGGVNGISGASILGDGQVVLILDINSLINSNLNEAQNTDMEKGQPCLATAAA